MTPNPALNRTCAKNRAGRLVRWAPMKAALVLSVTVALVTSSERAGAEAQCTAEGEPIQWAADYCMLKMETDDEIAASDCINEERNKPFPSNCASNLHFKRNMCELMILNGTRAGTVDQCVRDPTFRGRTVEAGGVGAQQVVPQGTVLELRTRPDPESLR